MEKVSKYDNTKHNIEQGETIQPALFIEIKLKIHVVNSAFHSDLSVKETKS